MKHVLGTDVKDDVVVYEEKDDTFYTSVGKTKSKEYIVISSSSTLTSEARILKADNPNGEFTVFQKRKTGLEYHILHYKSDFYILTNIDKAANFKIMKTAISKTNLENWKEVIPHRKETLIEDFSVFKDYLVIEERTNGLNEIRIKRWDNTADYYLPFDEETYSASVSYNPEFETNIIRYSYTSFTTPSSIIDFSAIPYTNISAFASKSIEPRTLFVQKSKCAVLLKLASIPPKTIGTVFLKYLLIKFEYTIVALSGRRLFTIPGVKSSEFLYFLSAV